MRSKYGILCAEASDNMNSCLTAVTWAWETLRAIGSAAQGSIFRLAGKKQMDSKQAASILRALVLSFCLRKVLELAVWCKLALWIKEMYISSFFLPAALVASAFCQVTHNQEMNSLMKASRTIFSNVIDVLHALKKHVIYLYTNLCSLTQMSLLLLHLSGM